MRCKFGTLFCVNNATLGFIQLNVCDTIYKDLIRPKIYLISQYYSLKNYIIYIQLYINTNKFPCETTSVRSVNCISEIRSYI